MDYFKMKNVHAGLLLIVICALFTGCAAVVVGGAGAGGYTVAKERRSIGEMTADAKVTYNINAAYVKDDLVKTMHIDVDTYLGIVTLRGKVANQDEATRAIDLALDADNVTEVISNLVIMNQALSPLGVVYRKE